MKFLVDITGDLYFVYDMLPDDSTPLNMAVNGLFKVVNDVPKNIFRGGTSSDLIDPVGFHYGTNGDIIVRVDNTIKHADENLEKIDVTQMIDGFGKPFWVKDKETTIWSNDRYLCQTIGQEVTLTRSAGCPFGSSKELFEGPFSNGKIMDFAYQDGFVVFNTLYKIYLLDSSNDTIQEILHSKERVNSVSFTKKGDIIASSLDGILKINRQNYEVTTLYKFTRDYNATPDQKEGPVDQVKVGFIKDVKVTDSGKVFFIESSRLSVIEINSEGQKVVKTIFSEEMTNVECGGGVKDEKYFQDLGNERNFKTALSYTCLGSLTRLEVYESCKGEFLDHIKIAIGQEFENQGLFYKRNGSRTGSGNIIEMIIPCH